MLKGHFFVQYLDLVKGDVVIEFQRLYMGEWNGKVVLGEKFFIPSNS